MGGKGMIQIGSLFCSRYRIDRYIGRGGMADVYKGFDTINRYDVAIKIVRSDADNKEELYQRFSNEISIAVAVQNHYNIVRILDFGKVDGTPYMVTEFITGQTLRDMLDTRKTFDFQEASFIVMQILDALSELHLHGIVHRDIKPQNIYVLSSGIVKVADFGISSFLNQNNSKIAERKVIVGTPQYLAPEIVLDGKISPQGDIYALGVTFFELITGRVPFNGKNPHETCDMQVTKPFPDITLYRPNTPQGLVDIIDKACEKSLKDRYQNVQEMKNDLANVLKDKKNLRSQNWFERLLGLKGK
jgi:serine/threonine protein kinase